MSDQKLRDLERRWKETGSPDDEAAYLLERVRVGDLSRERLELAAYCGHEGAMRATEDSIVPWSAAAKWGGAGVVRWGREASVRTAFACAQTVLPLLHGFEGADLVREAVFAVGEWLAGQASNEKSADAAERARGVTIALQDAGGTQWHACLVAAMTAELVGMWSDSTDVQLGGVARVPEASLLASLIQSAELAVAPAGAFSGGPWTIPSRPELQGTIRMALVPWALG